MSADFQRITCKQRQLVFIIFHFILSWCISYLKEMSMQKMNKERGRVKLNVGTHL